MFSDYGEVVVAIGLAQHQKRHKIAEDWKVAKQPTVISVLEVRKKPDEIETVTQAYQVKNYST